MPSKIERALSRVGASVACLAGAAGLVLGVACAAGALWLGVAQALSTEGRGFGKALGELGALLLAGFAVWSFQAGALFAAVGAGAWRGWRPAYLAGAALCLVAWVSPLGHIIFSAKYSLLAHLLNVTMGGSLLGVWLASRPKGGEARAGIDVTRRLRPDAVAFFHTPKRQPAKDSIVESGCDTRMPNGRAAAVVGRTAGRPRQRGVADAMPRRTLNLAEALKAIARRIIELR